MSLKSSVMLQIGKQKFDLAFEDGLFIGSSKHCNVELKRKSVSSTHCLLYHTEFGIAIMDIGSEKGTFVNNVCLPSNQFFFVMESCSIRVGKVKGILKINDEVNQSFATGARGFAENNHDYRCMCCRKMMLPTANSIGIDRRTGTKRKYDKIENTTVQPSSSSSPRTFKNAKRQRKHED